MTSNYATPHFRAVNSRGARRGIRLENIFWSAIEDITRRQGISVGAYFDRIEGEVLSEAGFSSRVRSAVANDLVSRLRDLERVNSRERAFALVLASPAPAFLLTDDKRIVRYNQAFFRFIQQHFSGVADADVLRSMVLSLDVQIGEVLSRLQAEPGRPVVAGFAIGIGERRARGRLNMVLASVNDAGMILAYVTP
ncbi:putative DNA-binding ribbon-helix-helix protein [Hoeflea marina]|uniref:Putative DNA-binding ribbon-helix-helix protein n=1 Tax=Hoeflea marina TaxID=274592 RepID=A0A317PV47_9HYPH|nr:ribbon-helix-helix domain-containing protein [Hoeflea marina]PWW04136.1 putative DNA-binding ribbon-helix-helix protein [Hoeflea marina]